jgi:hypothetical protein
VFLRYPGPSSRMTEILFICNPNLPSPQFKFLGSTGRNGTYVAQFSIHSKNSCISLDE